MTPIPHPTDALPLPEPDGYAGRDFYHRSGGMFTIPIAENARFTSDQYRAARREGYELAMSTRADLITEAHAQIRHLIDDLTTVVDDDGLARYVPPAANSLMYSNMIGALIPLAARMAEALASQPAQEQPDSDPNAPWLTLAHTICSDANIKPGHISDRLQALWDKMALQGAELKQQQAGSVVEVSDELVSVGGQLANVAFNWAQRAGHVLTGDDVAMLDKLRKQWDAALTQPQAQQAKTFHDSDCSVHNEPAYPAGPCDCGFEAQQAAVVPAESQILEACEEAGLWPNTAATWVANGAFRRYHESINRMLSSAPAAPQTPVGIAGRDQA